MLGPITCRSRRCGSAGRTVYGNWEEDRGNSPTIAGEHALIYGYIYSFSYRRRRYPVISKKIAFRRLRQRRFQIIISGSGAPPQPQWHQPFFSTTHRKFCDTDGWQILRCCRDASLDRLRPAGRWPRLASITSSGMISFLLSAPDCSDGDLHSRPGTVLPNSAIIDAASLVFC